MRTALLSFLLVAAVAATARADEVVLKNGGLLRGRVVSEDENEVVLQTDSGPVKIPRDKVKEVVRSKGSPPPAESASGEDAKPEPERKGSDADRAARVARGTLLLFGYDDCDRELLQEIASGVRDSLAIEVEVLTQRPRADEAEIVDNREQGLRTLAEAIGEPLTGTPDELERRMRAKLDRDPRPMAKQARKTLDDMVARKLNARVLGTQAAKVAPDRLAQRGVLAAIGVTGRDMSLPDMNFVFGRIYKEKKAGAMSYYRFKDEGERRDTVRRSVSEAVFLLAQTLGAERCTTRTCAAAPTNGVQQHDMKRTELCAPCRERFDAALSKKR